MKKIILATLGMGLLAVGFNASAATATDTITPSLTITNACSIDLTGFSAGLTPVTTKTTGAQSSASSPIKVVCNTDYKFGANGGSSYNATFRELTGVTSSAKIGYHLEVLGSATNADWGDVGITGSSALTLNDIDITGGAVLGETFNVQVVTNALLGTEVADIYSDTVTLTVEF